MTESEPNNNFRRADPIAVGDIIAGTIDGKRDQDFFVVYTSEYRGEYLLFDIDASVNGSPLDAVLCLYDEDHDLVGCADDSDRLDPLLYERMSHIVAGYWNIDWKMDEKVYVKVESYDYPHEGGVDHTYTLSVSQPLLVSADKSGRVGGVKFTKSDILAWQAFNNGTEKWSMLLDASDLGISEDLEALGHGNNHLAFVLAKDQMLEISGSRQTVKPQDIVGIDHHPTTLFSFGSKTDGSLHFSGRGQNIGLTTRAERIDALTQDWVVSTTGTAIHANGLRFKNEDLFNRPYGFLHFDGSTVPGMARENLIAAEYVNEGLAGVIQGSGKIFGHRVNQKQIFLINEDGTWGGIYWNGPDHDFNYRIDAIGR